MFDALVHLKIHSTNNGINLRVTKTLCNGTTEQPNLQIIQVTAELSVVSDGTIQKGEESLHVGAAGVTELIFQCLQLDVSLDPRLKIARGIEVSAPRTK